ncbi:MAG: encapsulin-associated ferritin-like protein [Polyangiaceae bacterium]
MGSENLHEQPELLSEATKNMHRALVSLREELEAVDWYQQRAEACSDPELAGVLQHNKREEIEHAMMTLEWIRRTSAEFDGNIAKYINSEGPILEVEENAKADRGEGGEQKSSGKKSSAKKPDGAISHADGSLGIGSLKGA